MNKNLIVELGVTAAFILGGAYLLRNTAAGRSFLGKLGVNTSPLTVTGAHLLPVNVNLAAYQANPLTGAQVGRAVNPYTQPGFGVGKISDGAYGSPNG